MATDFGMNLRCTSPTDASPIHLAGMEYDPETGTYHTLHRQYQVGLGRWLTADPAGKEAVHPDDPQTWNMYAYVRNNPLTLTDPTGEWSMWMLRWPVWQGQAEAKYNKQPSPPPQDKSLPKRALGYFYMKHENGTGVGVDFKIGPIKVDMGFKRDVTETKTTTEGSTTSSVRGVGVVAGVPGLQLGVGMETTQVTMENGTPVNQPINTEIVPGIKLGNAEGSHGEVGIGIGGCAIVCGGLSVGVQADKLVKDAGATIDYVSSEIMNSLSD